MRIAFFGGSFDPPHLGHLAVAEAAQQALALDQVLFAPVGLQPLKPLGSSASFEDRAAMTRLAIQHHSAFELSLADAPDPTQPKPNYTLETLTKLRQSLPPDAQLYLLLGADSFLTLHHWHRAAEIPFVANLIVASRPGTPLDDLANRLPPGVALHTNETQPNCYRLTNAAGQQSSLTILPDLHYDISATELRNQIHGTSSHPTHPIPAAVLAYIHHHHLYQ